MHAFEHHRVAAAVALFAVLCAGCGVHSSATGSPPAAARAAAALSPGRANVTLTVPATNHRGAFTRRRRLTLPRGWRAEVWALVAGARLEAWTPEGDLLVSQPFDGKVIELTPGRSPAAPPALRTVLSGLSSPQGLAFDRLAGQEVLYVAASNELVRYAWVEGAPAARTVLASRLPDGGAHPLKNVVVGRSHTVYMDIGSATNATPPASSKPLPRASVITYSPDGRRVRVFATGARNGDGLSFAPDGSLWAAVNQRDQIAYPFHRPYDGYPDAYGQVDGRYVSDHPPDEVARLHPGRNLGWPFCDPDPDRHPGHAGSVESYANLAWDADQETNAGSNRINCRKLPRIERGIPAHSAPLGFHFLEGSSLPRRWSGGAVIAAHGSWDRTPPRPPAVLWLPWQAPERTLGVARTLIGGFQQPDGSRWGRPADAVPGPDGALYVSDDTAGAIYRIVPAGSH